MKAFTRSDFVYPYCEQKRRADEQCPARKIFLRGVKLTAFDTKALLVHAEALLALEKGMGRKGNGIL